MLRIFALVSLLLFSCKGAENNSTQSVSIESLAKQHIGQSYERKDRGNFALCYSTSKTPGDERKTAVVFKIDNGEVVYGPERLNGKIDWESDEQLVITEYSGVLTDRDSPGMSMYYYDVINKKKLTSKENP